ncbi:hypothetical protein HK102_006445, partial [Quaeritorhiza haematococci]
IVRNRRHPYNLVQIRLFAYETLRPTVQEELGSVIFHVHDMIQASPLAGTYDLWQDNVQIGELDLEFTFSYGVFGYGKSYQLKEDDVTATDMIQYSLFPTINPPQEQCEPEENVLAVQATPHPSFIPFREPVYIAYGKEISPALRRMQEEMMYKPDILVAEMSKGFTDVIDQYYSMNDRGSRLLFLHNYLQKSSNRQEVVMTHKLEPEWDEYGFSPQYYTRFVVPVSSLLAASSNTDSNTTGPRFEFPTSPVLRRRFESIKKGTVGKGGAAGQDKNDEILKTRVVDEGENLSRPLSAESRSQGQQGQVGGDSGSMMSWISGWWSGRSNAASRKVVPE